MPSRFVRRLRKLDNIACTSHSRPKPAYADTGPRLALGPHGLGVDIAAQVGLTLSGRVRGKRAVCLSGAARRIRDAGPETVPENETRQGRKGAMIE